MGLSGYIWILSAALSSAVAIWREPTILGSLEVRVNSTATTYAAGDVVQYTCIGHNLSATTNTLYFAHQKGDIEWSISGARGPSELVYTRVVEATDTGTALLCNTVYTNSGTGDDYWRYFTYYVKAEPKPIVIGNAVPTTPAPIITSQSITMSSNATTTAHRVGDYVQFTCTTHNMPYVMLDMRQVKGYLEVQLHVGYQPSRVLTYELTAEDDGTSIYCQAWLTDDRFNSYVMNSNHIPITVTA